MKFFKWLFGFLLLAAVILAVGAYVYLQYFAKDVIQNKLSSILAQDVSIAAVSLHLPFGLKLDQVDIPTIGLSERMYVVPNWASVFNKTVEIQSVEFVGLKIKYNQLKIVDQNQNSAEESNIHSQVQASGENQPARTASATVLIRKVIINNGNLYYSRGDDKFVHSVYISSLRGQILDVRLPMSSSRLNFRFEATTSVPGTPIMHSRLTGKGWMNLTKKDLEGKIGVYNQKGVNQLSADIVSVNNQVSVDGVVKFKSDDAVFWSKDKPRSFEKMLYNLVGEQSLSVVTNFSFETQLDDFGIEQVAFSGKVEDINE